jgi:hypothetical protein
MNQASTITSNEERRDRQASQFFFGRKRVALRWDKVRIPPMVAFAPVAGFVGKRSRGDKTAIELFIAGVQGWEAGSRRTLDGGTSSSR